MIDAWKIELAVNILDRGKALAPDRFPKASPETGQAWASALSRTFDMLPAEIWPEAVDTWSVEFYTDRMATPGELRKAALLVRDRWEDMPDRRELLDAARERDRIERDRQIEAGTFALSRGHKPRAIENAGREVPGFVQDQIERMKRRKKI